MSDELININGVNSILVGDSIINGIEVSFRIFFFSWENIDTILTIIKLINDNIDKFNEIYWIDDGSCLDYLQMIELNEIISNRIKYIECFELESIFNQISNINDKDTMIIIININELFNSLKLIEFNKSNELITDILLKLRKFTDSSNSVILLDIDDHKKNIINFYIDKKYKITKMGLRLV